MSTAGIAERREKLDKGAVGWEATLARDSADTYKEKEVEAKSKQRGAVNAGKLLFGEEDGDGRNWTALTRMGEGGLGG